MPASSPDLLPLFAAGMGVLLVGNLSGTPPQNPTPTDAADATASRNEPAEPNKARIEAVAR